MNRSKLLIYATISAFVCILILSVILIYQSSKPSNSTFSQQQESIEQTTALLNEIGANINTDGLVIYSSNGFIQDQLFFVTDSTHSRLITIVNRSQNSKTFKLIKKPDSEIGIDQFTIDRNNFTELYLDILGEYVIEVVETGEKVTLTLE